MKEEPHTLGFLLGRAAATMATLLNQTLKSEGIDLPHSQFVILRHLYNEDGISQQELAERIFKDNAAIKRTLDNLEQKNSYNVFTSPSVKTAFSSLKKENSLCPRYYKVRKKPCDKYCKTFHTRTINISGKCWKRYSEIPSDTFASARGSRCHSRGNS